MFDIASAGFSWFYTAPRKYDQQGRRYVIRDVLVSAHRFAGFCQFKTRRDDGCIVWKPCPEGVEFSAIEPFEVA